MHNTITSSYLTQSLIIFNTPITWLKALNLVKTFHYVYKNNTKLVILFTCSPWSLMLAVLYSIALGVNGALAGLVGQLSGVAVKLAGVAGHLSWVADVEDWWNLAWQIWKTKSYFLIRNVILFTLCVCYNDS